MTNSETERRLRALRWPEPPVELRARVLGAVSYVAEAVTWSDRVWFSRSWRIAAAGIAVAAVAIDALPRRDVTMPQVQTNAQVVEDVGREIGVPPALTAVLAQRAAVPEPQPAAADRVRALRSIEEEGVAR